jgi:2-aminobenzoate-CoA ligase
MFAEATCMGPGDVLAAAAPLGHALGIIHHTIFGLLHGATAVFMERYQDPEVILTTVARYHVTTLTCLMMTWAKMADVARSQPKKNDFSSLRLCFAMWQSASGSDVFDFWLSQGIELLNNFGSTSFATWVLVPRARYASPRASLGRPLPGYTVMPVMPDLPELKPCDPHAVGRMAVKGPTGLTYWNLHELQRRDVVDGWTLQDDLIQFDLAGNAHYLGRTDYMISTGGFKVAPGEVESILSRHPAVEEVAVVPAPCPTRREIVAAFVVLRDVSLSEEDIRTELQEMVRAELASYKIPRRVEFVRALPRDSVGKVQTKIVKQWAETLVPQ